MCKVAAAAPAPASNDSDGDDDGNDEAAERARRLARYPKVVNPLDGLASDDAAVRLTDFGPNELVERKANPILKFLSYFWDPIAWLIEIAIVLSGVTQDWADFGIILCLLIINAIIGYVEEAKAENALAALRQTLALKSRVFRDGELKELPSRELVPGDVIIVRLGDIVPADCRLLGVGANGEEAGEVHIDQSALTGESLPIRKAKGDLAYSSSIVKQGQQLAEVVETGAHTYIGRAATLMSVTNEEGHFQKIVSRIGNFLIAITVVRTQCRVDMHVVAGRGRLVSCPNTPTIALPCRPAYASTQVMVLILLVVLLAAYDYEALPAIALVVIVTIAAIPVGLPTVLSVTMAVGAKQLAAKNCIVKRLPAIEELAGINILCSDKTGTLTLNELSMVDPYVKPPFKKEDLVFASFMASEPGANDAIELAVRRSAVQQIPHLVGTDVAANKAKDHVVTAFQPFDPTSKITVATIVNTATGKTFKVAKGAPHVIIRMAGHDTEASETVYDYAVRGLRCLGVLMSEPLNAAAASTDAGAPPVVWRLVGLLAFLDPPRPDSAATIAELNRLGVGVKMITGDQQVIGKEVAKRLGMHRTILTPEHLNDRTLSEHDKTVRCIRADGFAQVVPEDKFRVVELLQKEGMLIGMTGDGVNDAPALKKANVGIAVHGCTDAARSAADVVLLSPGLSVIVDAVLTARAIFQRMRSYALYRIASTVHFLLFFFISILALQFVLPPILIVLICLLNDAATLVISVDNARVSDKPDKWRLGQLLSLSIILGVILTISSFVHYAIGAYAFGLGRSQLNSIIYLQMSACPHFLIFTTRLPGHFWTNRPSWIFMAAIIGTQVIAFFFAVYGVWDTVALESGGETQIYGGSAPIGWAWGICIMASSVFVFVLMDWVKVVVYRHWSFELTAKLVPTAGRRAKLHVRRQERAVSERVAKNVEKVRNVVRIVGVLQRFDAYRPPAYTILKKELPAAHQ